MAARKATVVGHGVWKRLGLGLLVIATGLAVSTLGLAGDFYNHEIEGLDPGEESLLSPVHLMIFGGTAIMGLGFLIAALALRREGHTPLTMVTT